MTLTDPDVFAALELVAEIDIDDIDLLEPDELWALIIATKRARRRLSAVHRLSRERLRWLELMKNQLTLPIEV